MANLLLYSGTNDGYCSSNPGTFAAARSSSGDLVDSNNSYDTTAISHQYYSGRGTYAIRRAFFEFDTSGISVTPSAATLKIFGRTSDGSDMIAVRSEQGATLAAGDFNSFPAAAVTALGNSDGSGAGTLAGVSSFTYSAEITSWNGTGFNDITLNSTALEYMRLLDTFKVCVMNHDQDYLDIAGGTSETNGITWTERLGTTQDPYIDYTAAVAADNATFFGANF